MHSWKYLIIARTILIIHIIIMILLLIGAILVLYFPAYIPIHVALIATIITLHATTNRCPFTTLEKHFLKKGRGYDYPYGCYRYYFFKKFLNVEINETFDRNFLIATKIIPAILPLFYLAIQHLGT